MLLVLFKRFLRGAAAAEAEVIEQKLAPELIVARIRQGDELLREQFISDYKPYIAKTTSRFSKRYIDPTRDDEYSVALLAFNEAVNQYDARAGKSFIGFAETVIRRRLIDYVRKEQRHKATVPYSMFASDDDENAAYNAIEAEQAIHDYENKRVQEERRQEIMQLNDDLMEYGITFGELVDLSPKHSDSRQMLIGIARTLAGEYELMNAMRSTQKMPIKELMERCGVSRKTIERNRKYIIAIALIMSGLYPYMHDYLHIPLPLDQEYQDEEVSR